MILPFSRSEVMEAVALLNKSLKMLKAFTFLQPAVDSTPEVKEHKRKEKLTVLERDPEDDVVMMEEESKNIQEEIEELLENEFGQEISDKSEHVPNLGAEQAKTESTPDSKEQSSISTPRTRRNRFVFQFLPKQTFPRVL